MEYTPDVIKSLEINEVIVIGTNPEGRHGKGGALIAKQKFGAIYGQAEGLQGQSYGIITKELRYNYPKITLDQVATGIIRFILFAESRPDLKFYVTKIGTQLAGFTEKEIGDIFRALNPKMSPNVVLPKEFT